jgi:putative flippase GtrA
MTASSSVHVSKRRRTQFVRFLVVGGIAALVNILSRIALNYIMSYQVAIVIAYVGGMTTAYVLNKLFVFSPSGRAMHDEYIRFAIINLLAVTQVWIVSVGLAFYVFPFIGFEWHTETLAHIIGVMVPTITSYLGHRYFSFAALP